MSLYTGQVVFRNNHIFENSFNSFSNSSTAGSIYITNSVAIVTNNTIVNNGDYQYGLPIVSVSDGAAILEHNQMSHLFCREVCVIDITASTV